MPNVHLEDPRIPAEDVARPGLAEADFEERPGAAVEATRPHGLEECAGVEAAPARSGVAHVVAGQGHQCVGVVGVAVGGGGPHLALQQQRDPVGARQPVALHRRPVQQLHGVEVDVAQARPAVRLRERVVRGGQQRQAGLEGGARHGEVAQVAAVPAIRPRLARVVELQDGPLRAGAQRVDDLAQAPVLGPRRAAPVGVGARRQGKGVGVPARVGVRGTGEGARHLGADHRRDAAVEPHGGDGRPVVEDVVVLGPRTIGVINDNNYPFSIGRHVGTGDPDDNEFIVIRLDETLERRRHHHHHHR